MSTQVTTAFVKQYSAVVTHLAQQKETRLRSACRNETINGEESFFDQVGTVTMTEVTDRHADTFYEDTPHSRRHVTTKTFQRSDLIDRPDRVRTLIDPTNDYTMAFGRAGGRRIDQTILDAMFANAKTGKTGSTTVTFAQDGGQTVTAATLSTDHLLTAKQHLDTAEHDSNDGYTTAITAVQVRQLLVEDTGSGAQFSPVASRDFGSGAALQTGELSTYVGIQIRRTELIAVDGSSNDRCPVWHRPSMLVAFGIEPRGEVDVMPNKRYSTQVFYELDLGATRMEGTGVVELLCTP